MVLFVLLAVPAGLTAGSALGQLEAQLQSLGGVFHLSKAPEVKEVKVEGVSGEADLCAGRDCCRTEFGDVVEKVVALLKGIEKMKIRCNDVFFDCLKEERMYSKKTIDGQVRAILSVLSKSTREDVPVLIDALKRIRETPASYTMGPMAQGYSEAVVDDTVLIAINLLKRWN